MHNPSEVLAGARGELARLPTVLEALLIDFDATTWRTRPAAAEWAPVEIVCHLRDEEVEDFGARLRVVLESGTSFVPIDPERWVVERRYLEDDGPRALSTFRKRRTASLEAPAAVVPARLTATVEHNRFGGLSGLDILAAWVAHDRLHLVQLAATLARCWAARWEPLCTDYAGPIPYPGS